MSAAEKPRFYDREVKFENDIEDREREGEKLYREHEIPPGQESNPSLSLAG